MGVADRVRAETARLALTEVGLEMEMGRLSLSHGGQGGGTIYLCAF